MCRLSRLICDSCQADTIHIGLICIHCGTAVKATEAAPPTKAQIRWLEQQRQRALKGAYSPNAIYRTESQQQRVHDVLNARPLKALTS